MAGKRNYTLTRVARGKLQDKEADKDIDNLVSQLEKDFGGILNKLDSFQFRNTTDLRSVDANTATLGEIVNVFATFIKDFKEILST